MSVGESRPREMPPWVHLVFCNPNERMIRTYSIHRCKKYSLKIQAAIIGRDAWRRDKSLDGQVSFILIF